MVQDRVLRKCFYPMIRLCDLADRLLFEVIWSEKCYCDPPLAHERVTVLDRYFNDLNTEAIGEYELFDGRPFMEYLNESIARTEDGRSDRH